ncbi:MAG TPA: NPCBM/NEW2 domain-containing protein, partial [Tepidisphaeraceae bacterium]|nr:NPCBM/NEW2 domain-containing protein [Tepidisphaeraceae bacterium]
TVPLTQLTAITRGPAPVSKLDRPAAEDVVRLLNGDVVRGIITEVTADALTVAAGDASTPLQVASIASVRFATAGAEATVRPAFRVALDDGSAASADAIAFDGATWTLSAANQPDAQVSSARVVAIDHLAGPLAWLSSLPPAEQVYTPYLTEQFPPRLDQSVTGGPIQFGEQTFARGIGVHARTTLTWEMGTAGYGTFRTRYAVADGAPLASPVVRVRVDGNVVHEATARPGDLSAVVTADVSTARTLTLEVDFSPAGHATQARVNWIEPALLRGPVR